MPWLTVANSDIGAREEQQDRYLVARNDDGTHQLLAVADGAGGHSKGAVAAHTAITHVKDNLTGIWASDDPQEFLRQLIIECNRKVCSIGDDDLACTTIVIVFIRSDELFWGHVGDSRLYLIRDDQVVVQTRDHSIGELRNTQADHMIDNASKAAENELYMCLGALSDITPELNSSAARQGDVLLLCSDGLWGQIDMAKTVSEFSCTGPTGKSLGTTVEHTIAAAKASMPKTSDNITLVASTFVNSPSIFKRFINTVFRR